MLLTTQAVGAHSVKPGRPLSRRTPGAEHPTKSQPIITIERRASKGRLPHRPEEAPNRFEHLMGLLAFIRTAHYWAVPHPELSFEEDVRGIRLWRGPTIFR